jgi:hypothetical protein
MDELKNPGPQYTFWIYNRSTPLRVVDLRVLQAHTWIGKDF